MEKYFVHSNCKYCSKEVDIIKAEFLTCKICNLKIHILCLKRQITPGGLIGDTFFDFICKECSENGNEVFVREKMKWLNALLLTLYNLERKSAGTANNGFFHWKIHIVTFINKQWNVIFPKNTKQKKNWMGTISGSLSHFSPCFFTKGCKDLGASGWWKLTFPNVTPTFMVALYNELSADKKITFKTEDNLVFLTDLIKKYVPNTFNYENHFTDNQSFLNTDYLLNEKITSSTISDVEEEHKINCSFLTCTACSNDNRCNFNDKIENPWDDNIDISGNEPLINIKNEDTKTDDFTAQELNVTNFSNDSENSSSSESDEDPNIQLTKPNFYNLLNLYSKKCNKKFNANITPLRIVEENVLYDYLLKFSDKNDQHAISLIRKLKVRLIKRKKNFKLLNIDNKRKYPIANIYDDKNRFSHYYNEEKLKIHSDSSYFQMKLIPYSAEVVNFILSPYTKRILKPYIRREENSKALWLKLMHECLFRANMKNENWIEPRISTIDYCYIQPMHVPMINNLCEHFFWPGIDMSESLQYPDFSCVVLYKKIVIGFAFLVPDVKFNEAYVSFIFTRPEWRRAGIAKFMLYHLIQTCLGKDITLHVGIDNPAIFLYQKFGFKVEKIIYNFYDAYLRNDSNQSKHAFFLRLERL